MNDIKLAAIFSYIILNMCLTHVLTNDTDSLKQIFTTALIIAIIWLPTLLICLT